MKAGKKLQQLAFFITYRNKMAANQTFGMYFLMAKVNQ